MNMAICSMNPLVILKFPVASFWTRAFHVHPGRALESLRGFFFVTTCRAFLGGVGGGNGGIPIGPFTLPIAGGSLYPAAAAVFGIWLFALESKGVRRQKSKVTGRSGYLKTTYYKKVVRRSWLSYPIS